jgi:hypothetical protein
MDVSHHQFYKSNVAEVKSLQVKVPKIRFQQTAMLVLTENQVVNANIGKALAKF